MNFRHSKIVDELDLEDFPDFKVGDVISCKELTWLFDSLLSQVNADLAQINFGSLEVVPFDAKEHIKDCIRDLKLRKDQSHPEYPSIILKIKKDTEIPPSAFAFMGLPWHNESPFVNGIQFKESMYVEGWFAEKLADFGIYLWNPRLTVSLGDVDFDGLYLDTLPRDWDDLLSAALRKYFRGSSLVGEVPHIRQHKEGWVERKLLTFYRAGHFIADGIECICDKASCAEVRQSYLTFSLLWFWALCDIIQELGVLYQQQRRSTTCPARKIYPKWP